ncbi:GNAT family N-acetyltransferase [Intrasporangium sp.]|uniref:GNAT family N-acetyltransferase n=1 Tax=Intrasporangium sp. TaxID=1925024 RepID=UPI00293B7117|nr:GNAT family N-acetyltransferase [Intrasporangium sp.]MDV3223536.1 GNAT family N-acetyltransferase [Intrasporangium sp.]
MTTVVWPVQGLWLRTADVDLRVMTEADLASVCDSFPADVEQDPAATRYALLDEGSNRRAVVAQSYWRALGTWSPASWALPFVARNGDGDVLGMQWLEGPDFSTDRVVDSASWLVAEVRGRGLGTQLRTAVLELAFRHLGAGAAVSSAVVANAASLGVSRSLGYRDTHTSVLEHSGETLQHVRLERDAWVASGRGASVRIGGVGPALPYFGLGDEDD